GNRKNFLLDSVWKFYYPKGKIQKTVDYQYGKKNGLVTNFDTAGKISSKENYKDDIRNGNSYVYYNSGKTHFVVPYVKGKPDGEAREFSEDSVLIGITNYKAGFIDRFEKLNRTDEKGLKQGKWKEFFDDGTVKKEISYRDNTLDGYVKEFDKKGNIVTTEKFNSGKKIENPKELRGIQFYKEYYADRTLKFEGGFIDNYPQGFHYYYNEKGISDSTLYYDEGFLLEKGKTDTLRRKFGKWTEYHVTGELRGSGNYTTGKKTGEWKYFYNAGKTEQTGKYDAAGLQEGPWKWYYENGNLMREEFYVKGKRSGELADYTEEGKVITKGEYIDDNQEGPWEYEMGNYKEKGNYSLGLRDSVWNAWYTTTGKLRYNGNWSGGMPEGKHVWYFENGKKMFEGPFTAGERNGDWKFYDDNGMLFLVITYQNDQETKFDGIKVYPTYEEAMSIFDSFKKENTTPDKNKKKEENESEN
ncbi:MAG: hypothetical protein IAF38_20040, partial [Bacteroidia bacterium]|nr:hypothetical protein [Bacteroidia bacterium]